MGALCDQQELIRFWRWSRYIRVTAAWRGLHSLCALVLYSHITRITFTQSIILGTAGSVYISKWHTLYMFHLLNTQ